MEKSNHASVEVGIAWRTPQARHFDRYLFHNVNFWRDYFPGSMGEKLAQSGPGDVITGSFAAGEVLPERNGGNIWCLREQNLRLGANGGSVMLRQGRFYPKGLLGALPGIYPQDHHPFRYLGGQDRVHVADLNHPLAGLDLTVKATLVELLPAKEERGGRCNDVVQEVCDNGPGLQREAADGETDFFSGEPFARQDMTDDACFYASPRLVNHLDNSAMEHVRAVYAPRLKPGMKVLDLMSSWNSHLPGGLPLAVTGLGMNAEELAANPRLSARVVHDLNLNPVLPFDDEAFDAAICTVSVEYLTKPIEVFQEVARVLRPAAPFVVTFSNRWFPPKAVKIWTELHPFERLGLVKAYFQRATGFEHLDTESIRGYLRPADDKYARLTPLADPIYVVSGTRSGSQPGC
ncbi:MAG: methyltransferase domain-containing protein [Gammaproteobacteria bacterium]